MNEINFWCIYIFVYVLMIFVGFVYWVGIFICCIIKNDKIYCIIRYKFVFDKCSLIFLVVIFLMIIVIISVYIVNGC